ncbi:MAG: Hpt domain-containing protein [Mailhella sp.]|nr:Hpt domain-containing protein [Mailhella sp.]
MTLRELYESIDGDYEAAKRILPMDKMISKFIILLLKEESCGKLMKAAEANDSTGMFEGAHSMKGVCGNLGLLKLSSMASTVAEEFRPGKPRKMSDEELKSHLDALNAKYQDTIAAIKQFAAEQE